MGSVVIRDLQAARGTEVENSTVEGSLARSTFAANELTPGKVYHFSGHMLIVDNNSTDTATLRLRFGTTSATPASNTSVAASGAIDVADSDFASIMGTIHVVSATRAVIQGFHAAPDAANTEAAYAFGAVVTIAADTEYYLDWTCDWSVAHADNEAAAESWACVEIAG